MSSTCSSTTAPLPVVTHCNGLQQCFSYARTNGSAPAAIIRMPVAFGCSTSSDWPVDLWTSPSDRPKPYGTRGQVMANIPVGHDLPTLSGLSPTGSTGSQQRKFYRQDEKSTHKRHSQELVFLSTNGSILVSVATPSASTSPAYAHSRAESHHITTAGIATTTAACNSYLLRQALQLAWSASHA